MFWRYVDWDFGNVSLIFRINRHVIRILVGFNILTLLELSVHGHWLSKFVVRFFFCSIFGVLLGWFHHDFFYFFQVKSGVIFANFFGDKFIWSITYLGAHPVKRVLFVLFIFIYWLYLCIIYLWLRPLFSSSRWRCFFKSAHPIQILSFSFETKSIILIYISLFIMIQQFPVAIQRPFWNESGRCLCTRS